MKKQGFSDLYIVDEQGIERNQPQYDFYQRISPLLDIWVDTGPRTMEDVVDEIFAGAKRVIIRLNLWMEESLTQIHELTDHDIFLAVDNNQMYQLYSHPILYEEADGLVVFMTSGMKTDFKSESILTQVMRYKPIYIFDSKENETYWASKKINGLLQDINLFM
jgi:uncharacterized protein related to proFAR isomerase